MNVRTNILGYPRIGPMREIKRAVEAYWRGGLSRAALLAVARTIRKQNWQFLKSAGIDLIPSNDFSLYDHVLDTCCMLGAVPPRFAWHEERIDLDLYFAMARGLAHASIPAMEMTKWLDTNYHYLVPELHRDQTFRLASDKPFEEFKEADAIGIKTKPVFLGPFSFLKFSKVRSGEKFDPLSLIERVAPVYAEVLRELALLGARWAQMDEPALALDLWQEERDRLQKAYEIIHAAAPEMNLIVTTYFGPLRDNLGAAVALPVRGLHFDMARGADELPAILDAFPKDKYLSLGIVDGRNVWRNDFDRSLALLRTAEARVGRERLFVATSCSLLHSPVSLSYEKKLDPEIRNWMAFAEEKVREVRALADLVEGTANASVLPENQGARASRRESPRIVNAAIRQRCKVVGREDLQRSKPFKQRRELQQRKLSLPLLPTTTIGSFPQTSELRDMRAKARRKQISAQEYEQLLEGQIRRAIEVQEAAGLDVLVHGEFERTDMVEYFGEQLEGFVFTQNGWVQSYGTRCVKPPVIYGDVRRPKPMTVQWTRFAQSLTAKPVKGMLTGPVTVLQWSFDRDDLPRSEIAKQIAFAIREEVDELERAGVPIIQIDEPALREGLPLRRADWEAYLRWGIEAFQVASSGVRDETQIHTHMCYAEFGDILDAIARLDADVISIEASRSQMELLRDFGKFKYPNEVGPGVWDVHSPRVPTVEEMTSLLEKAARVIPPERLWVNPDCGLKTRAYEEVIPALKNMVAAAKMARSRIRT